MQDSTYRYNKRSQQKYESEPNFNLRERRVISLKL